jgi:exodeoxyribonuclease VII small subunit
MTTQPSERSFVENYQELKYAADALQNMQEPDVDRIMPLVNQGMNAYREVKLRIEAVRAALSEVEPT